MGQAKRRGSFEERKRDAVIKESQKEIEPVSGKSHISSSELMTILTLAEAFNETYKIPRIRRK